MKKITLLVCAITMGTLSFAQTIICPTAFKRDNGNGRCPDGQLTFTFTTCPNPGLTIDSIYRGGIKQTITVAPPTCSNGKASYCITGGNLGPAGSLLVYFSQGGIPGTGYGCYVPEGGPLPISLTSFYAKRSGNSVSLVWNTAAEINAKEFILQRKTDNVFVDIAVIAASNKADGNTYNYTDNNATKKITEYRLKMVDADGSFKMSDIKTIKGTAAASDFIIYPNPSTGNAKISITDISEPTDVQLIDNAGRIIKTISMLSTNTVDLNNLQKGMYLIRIVNKQSGVSTTKKLTVLN